MKSRLSILIPAYGQHELTKVHVRECMNSSVVPDEIVVVNDGGDPSLRDMLYELPKNTTVVYARIKEDIPWNYNGAVNLAFWLSRGDYIAIEDTDHVPLREAYKNGMNILDERPEINRVSYSRYWTPLLDVLNKPFEEWSVTGRIGPNAMVAMYRRELYTQIKGQDERMRAYGWLAYDFQYRCKRVGINAVKTEQYFIVKDGSEPNLKRGLSVQNRRVYRENVYNPHFHSKHGILNFDFDYEIWKANTQV